VAAAFYQGLFGWSSKEVAMGGPAPYLMLRSEALSEDVGGAMVPMMEGVPPHWLDYVTVDDLGATLAKIAEAGGQVVSGVMQVPNVGSFAVALDPTGAAFAPFQSANPGATDTERVPPVGTFCWSQFMTTNLDASVPFYNAIFGWEPEAMGPGMVVFKSGATPRCSAMANPPEAPAASHWLKYVAVEDADASFAKAITLGAAALHPPTTMPGMGRFAILADPTGAVFAVWKDLSVGAA
jgi:predicted enzyme related to lactoylglutathione lyase